MQPFKTTLTTNAAGPQFSVNPQISAFSSFPKIPVSEPTPNNDSSNDTKGSQKEGKTLDEAQRKERNRRFAKESRKRKKHYISQLETKVESLELEVKSLRTQLKQVKKIRERADQNLDTTTRKDVIGSLFEQEELIKQLFADDENEAKRSLDALKSMYGNELNREENIRYKFKALIKSLIPDYIKMTMMLTDKPIGSPTSMLSFLGSTLLPGQNDPPRHQDFSKVIADPKNITNCDAMKCLRPNTSQLSVILKLVPQTAQVKEQVREVIKTLLKL